MNNNARMLYSFDESVRALLLEQQRAVGGMMKSVSFRAFVLIMAVIVMTACGKKPSEAERSYAEVCIKIMKGEVYRRLCECEAGIVASKLTPGELKVYLASMDWPQGKAMNQAEVSKFAADHGFTMDDMKGRDEKMQTLLPEVNKTCLPRRN